MVGGSVTARSTSSVGAQPLEPEAVEQGAVVAQVVVLDVHRPQPGVAPLQAVALAVGLEDPLLGHPVDHGGHAGPIVLEAGEDLFPASQRLGAHLFAHALQAPLPLVLAGLLEELPLDVERREPPAALEQPRCGSGWGRG